MKQELAKIHEIISKIMKPIHFAIKQCQQEQIKKKLNSGEKSKSMFFLFRSFSPRSSISPHFTVRTVKDYLVERGITTVDIDKIRSQVCGPCAGRGRGQKKIPPQVKMLR